jgi:hypothetical protein
MTMVRAVRPGGRVPKGWGAPLAGVALILAGWAAALLFDRYDLAEELARVDGENALTASAFEEHSRRILRTADNALQFLRRGVEYHGAVTPDMAAFAALTMRDLEAYQVAVADEHGDLIYSALPLPGPVNIADREHFQVHQRSDGAGLHIGKPVLSKVGGHWLFFVSRRISRPGGGFAGVVTIGLDPCGCASTRP